MLGSHNSYIVGQMIYIEGGTDAITRKHLF